MSRPRPRIAVVVFPGSNDDRDALWALGALGAEAVLVWHADDGAARPVDGGRPAGRLLVRRLPPLRRDRALLAGDATRSRAFAADGGLGARDLQRLPDPLRGRAAARACCARTRRSRSSAATCRVRVERADTPFTSRCAPAQQLTIPVKHGEGCWYADAALLAELEASRPDRPALRAGDNPNGVGRATSPASATRTATCSGLMPHPEHAVDPLLGSGDGALLLASLVDAARERSLALSAAV